MKTIKKSLIYITLHIIAFAVAAFVASQTSSLLVEPLFEASSNISITIKGMINAAFLFSAFYMVNNVLKVADEYSQPLVNKSNLLIILCSLGSILLIVGILFGFNLYLLQNTQGFNELGYVLFALFAQSLSQELLFRGILFRGMSKHVPILTTVLSLSVIFALLNVLVDGVHPLPFVAAASSCFILCMLYHWKKSLILNAIVNTSWVYVVFLTGVLDEHWRSSAPMVSHAHNNVFLSGAHYGPEASIFGLAVLTSFSVWLFSRYRANQLV